jgi:hypothetical protein
MVARLAAVFFAVLAMSCNPAMACMGQTVLLAESFQSLGLAWGLWLPFSYPSTAFDAANGFAKLTPSVGDYAVGIYQGLFFDTADACVDVINPQVNDPSQSSGGLVFGLDQTDNFYVLAVRQDGQAAVMNYRSDTQAWTYLVPWKQVAELKTGANSTNTLRVTWSGTSANTYLNGTAFATVQIPQFNNTVLGIWCEGDPQSNPTLGATYQFANFKVTSVP